ncbi:hypothetical protein PENSPDRAFT_598127 [Peniophora sp. CONT]|nr:hypothetical protein PENSPDRAFT_598127 [Peniophora sp. CONT]
MAPSTRSPRKSKLEPLLAKGISTDALLHRLEALHTRLSSLEQDDAKGRAALGTVHADLIHLSILHHKDPGVRAWAACCLAEILRLHAPDAPYTDAQLRDIFQFFTTQLQRGLRQGPDAPYYDRYFALLESLSSVKSIVLISDLPAADALTIDVFRAFFELVRRRLPKKVEIYFADILIALVEECATVPPEALEVLMAQFMDKNAGNENPAYRLAVTLAQETADKLQRHVCQYFTDTLLSPTLVPPSSPRSSPAPNGHSDSDLAEAAKAHELVAKLHAAAPALLHNVIPQIELELGAGDAGLRAMATQALSTMYAARPTSSGSGSGSQLARQYPSTWTAWLGRRNDRAVPVRLALVEGLKGALAGVPEKRAEIEEGMKSKLLDPDERVRKAVCRVVGGLEWEVVLRGISIEVLKAVAERGLDKRPAVRQAALDALGTLYAQAYAEIDAGVALATRQLAWIPDTILRLACATIESRAAAEIVIARDILPLPSLSSNSTSISKSTSNQSQLDESQNTPTQNGRDKGKGKEKEKGGEVDEAGWTDRLLTTLRLLSQAGNEPGINLLLALTGVKGARPGIWARFLDACVAYNGGVTDSEKDESKNKVALDSALGKVAASLSEGLEPTAASKVTEDLRAFAKMNEGRLYKLLRTCMDTSSDLKAICRASAEFTKRVESANPALAPTLNALLRKSSLRIMNTSSIPTLLRRLSPSSSLTTSASQSQTQHSQTQAALGVSLSGSKDVALSNAKSARMLLVLAAKHLPALFEGHVALLCRSLALSLDGDDDDEQDGEEGESERAVVVQCLAAVCAHNPELLPTDKRTRERIRAAALGGAPRAAKFAARLVARGALGEGGSLEIVETIADALQDADETKLVAHIAVLAQLARLSPDAFEARSEDVIAFLVKRVLMVSCEDEDESGPPPPALRARVLALKVCRARCLAHADSDAAQVLAAPVLRMFVTLLRLGGALKEGEDDAPRARALMRAQAAVSLLHLACVPAFREFVGQHFVLLALTMQDPVYEVRHTFLHKLLSLLKTHKLPTHFHAITFLTAHDPEPEIQSTARAYVRYASRAYPPTLRLQALELPFARLLHLLAHHPDFGLTEESLPDIAKYIDIYIEAVSDRDNISLLYHIAGRLKGVRDAESVGASENLYVLSELAGLVVRRWAKAKGWVVSTYPKKVKLPADVFRPLPTPEAANEIMRRTYLPEAAPSWLADKEKADKAAAAAEKPRAPRKRKAPVAEPREKKKAGRPRKKKRGDKWREQEEEDEEDEEESGSDEDEEDDVPVKVVKGKGTEEKRETMASGRAARASRRASHKKEEEEEEESDGAEEPPASTKDEDVRMDDVGEPASASSPEDVEEDESPRRRSARKPPAPVQTKPKARPTARKK